MATTSIDNFIATNALTTAINTPIAAKVHIVEADVTLTTIPSFANITLKQRNPTPVTT